MDSIEEIDLISSSEKYLIDYSNINDNLIKNQKSFLNNEQFNDYLSNKSLGIPLLLPLGLECFDYTCVTETYKLSISDIANKIFLTQNLNYLGVRKFLEFGNEFCIGAKPKKKFNRTVNLISGINNHLKKLIIELKKENKSIAAFQTRNIPHLGHEKIIQFLLSKFDYVIINPVIGPKKKGDAKNNILAMVFEFLNKNFYDNRVFFSPICANMFYAGPREAIHHSILRESVGFDGFIVGRDHAGAENEYHPEDAPKLVKNIKKNIKMDIITHEGSYYSNKKKDIIIKNKNDNQVDLINISGTDFRKFLIQKKLFKFARPELQEFIFNLKQEIFY